jgi:hypothetical protein
MDCRTGSLSVWVDAITVVHVFQERPVSRAEVARMAEDWPAERRSQSQHAWNTVLDVRARTGAGEAGN